MKKLFLIFAAAAAGAFIPAAACTNFIITKGASTDSSVMVSYAADSHALYGALYHTPAGHHMDGAMLPVYEWDTGRYLTDIPQIARTWSTIGNMNEHSLIIGETLFGRGGMWVKAVAAVAGSVIYRFIIALALRANVPSECLKLISAVIVALAIAAPALKAKADFRRRRANAQKGGARHA